MRYSDIYADPRQTSRWKRFRRAVLARYPLCEGAHCGHCATEVHHVHRVTQRPDLAFDWSNVQSLCHDCHRLADQGKLKTKARPALEVRAW